MSAQSVIGMRMPRGMRTWWEDKTVGERHVLAALMASVATVLFWVALWTPLSRDIDRLRIENGRQQEALQTARRDVDEMLNLQRSPTPAPSLVQADVDQSLATSDLRKAVTALQWQQNRAHVTFAAVDFAKLVQWLERLHRDRGIVVHEANLSARVESGTVRAELVLGR
ncbi:MAG: type II secretion system protein M [Pseudomonadota bacterium]|nr:type II secretion system protein M [Pseudomonadota bacterium]